MITHFTFTKSYRLSLCFVCVLCSTNTNVAIAETPAQAIKQTRQEAEVEDALYLCLKSKFNHVERNYSDHGNAFDPDAGRNFHYDKDKQAWIDSKTGECICPKCADAPAKAAAEVEDALYLCLKSKFNHVERNY